MLLLFRLNNWIPGNYLKFYDAIRSAYPDIKIISNCDASSRPLDHPADMYDYHVMSSNNVFDYKSLHSHNIDLHVVSSLITLFL